MTGILDHLRGRNLQAKVEDIRPFNAPQDLDHEPQLGGPPRMSFPAPPTDYIPRNHRRQHLTEAAMKAADYVNGLETELEQLRSELNTHAATISVLTESNVMLHEDNDNLKRENERLIRENTAVATRITMAAEVLLMLRKPVESQHDHETKAPTPSQDDTTAPEATQPSDGRPEGRQSPDEDRKGWSHD